MVINEKLKSSAKTHSKNKIKTKGKDPILEFQMMPNSDPT